MSMSHVPENLPSPPILADILRGKAGKCSGIWRKQQAVPEDSEPKENLGEREQGSDEEGGYPAEGKPPTDDEREEEFIPNLTWGRFSC